MWNLLSNAIKFTPKDGQVRIRAQACPGDVVITVADTGQGIEANDRWAGGIVRYEPPQRSSARHRRNAAARWNRCRQRL